MPSQPKMIFNDYSCVAQGQSERLLTVWSVVRIHPQEPNLGQEVGGLVPDLPVYCTPSGYRQMTGVAQ